MPVLVAFRKGHVSVRAATLMWTLPFTGGGNAHVGNRGALLFAHVSPQLTLPLLVGGRVVWFPLRVLTLPLLLRMCTPSWLAFLPPALRRTCLVWALAGPRLLLLPARLPNLVCAVFVQYPALCALSRCS